MPVTVTTKELVDAATSGALARYFALEKPVTVAWKNRKQVETCEREFKRCNELRTRDLQEARAPRREDQHLPLRGRGPGRRRPGRVRRRARPAMEADGRHPRGAGSRVVPEGTTRRARRRPARALPDRLRVASDSER